MRRTTLPQRQTANYERLRVAFTLPDTTQLDGRLKAEIPREQFYRNILVAFSWHPRRHARTPDTRDILAIIMLRGCRACRATSPFSLPHTGWPAVLWCIIVLRLFVCHVILQISRARHARFVADILTRCHEDATMILRGNCSRGISAYKSTVELCRVGQCERNSQPLVVGGLALW